MKKIVLKGLLKQAEQLTREQKKNIVGGYGTPPPPTYTVYCQNAGGYIIGTVYSGTCNQATNVSICKGAGYSATTHTSAVGC